MFKKPQNLKGLTMNLVLGLFKQCSCIQIFFASLENESLWVYSDSRKLGCFWEFIEISPFMILMIMLITGGTFES